MMSEYESLVLLSSPKGWETDGLPRVGGIWVLSKWEVGGGKNYGKVKVEIIE